MRYIGCVALPKSKALENIAPSQGFNHTHTTAQGYSMIQQIVQIMFIVTAAAVTYGLVEAPTLRSPASLLISTDSRESIAAWA